jgi:hypothetical protein
LQDYPQFSSHSLSSSRSDFGLRGLDRAFMSFSTCRESGVKPPHL